MTEPPPHGINPSMYYDRTSILELINAYFARTGKTLRGLSLVAGISYDTLYSFYKGDKAKNLSQASLKKILPVIAAHLNYSPVVQVLGRAGAGGEIFPIDDHAKGAGISEAPMPPGGEEYTLAAIEVDGESMKPFVRTGWIVYYSREERIETHRCDDSDAQKNPILMDPLARFLREPCIIKLCDGRLFLKELRKGSEPGLYTLHSYNDSDIEDVQIEWAAKVMFVKPE